uniref:Uncharacterized protein n=1 Tax=Amphimedon queenslandica TaxID=400682 RepID=A0A1X7VJD5_AMPQE
RIKKRPEEPIDPQILTVDDTTSLCLVLRLFVFEARKANCNSYPPSIIRNLLSGINRKLTKSKIDVAILDKSDHHFQELHLTLDSISSELHRAEIGVKKESV